MKYSICKASCPLFTSGKKFKLQTFLQSAVKHENIWIWKKNILWYSALCVNNGMLIISCPRRALQQLSTVFCSNYGQTTIAIPLNVPSDDRCIKYRCGHKNISVRYRTLYTCFTKTNTVLLVCVCLDDSAIYSPCPKSLTVWINSTHMYNLI